MAVKDVQQRELDPNGFGQPSPVGAIIAYGGAAAPSGWLLCDGSAVSRITFAALFAVLGTAFGAGDGLTTFNLPDLRQRFPLGKAAAGTGSTLGGTGGAIDHTHVTTTHSANVGIILFTTQAAPPNDPMTSTANNPPFQAVNFIVKT